jgi:hypothetical protein
VNKIVGYAALHAAGALVLVATAANWLLAGWAGHFAWVAVLLIAAFKCRVVMREFMELSRAPRPWRLAFDLWLLALTLLIGTARWMATGG